MNVHGRPYFQRLSEYLALLWCQLEEARGSSAMEEANDEQQDLLMSPVMSWK